MNLSGGGGGGLRGAVDWKTLSRDLRTKDRIMSRECCLDAEVIRWHDERMTSFFRRWNDNEDDGDNHKQDSDNILIPFHPDHFHQQQQQQQQQQQSSPPSYHYTIPQPTPFDRQLALKEKELSQRRRQAERVETIVQGLPLLNNNEKSSKDTFINNNNNKAMPTNDNLMTMDRQSHGNGKHKPAGEQSIWQHKHVLAELLHENRTKEFGSSTSRQQQQQQQSSPQVTPRKKPLSLKQSQQRRSQGFVLVNGKNKL